MCSTVFYVSFNKKQDFGHSMMSLILCTKKVPTDQIPLPFYIAKDEINLQNAGEKIMYMSSSRIYEAACRE